MTERKEIEQTLYETESGHVFSDWTWNNAILRRYNEKKCIGGIWMDITGGYNPDTDEYERYHITFIARRLETDDECARRTAQEMKDKESRRALFLELAKEFTDGKTTT